MKPIRSIRMFGAWALAVLLAGAALPALAGHHEAGEEKEAARSVYIVKVHADWCGTCTRLEPTWKQIEAKLGDRAELVVFDVTDRDSVAAARAEADRLGLRAVFDAHKSRTGTIAIVDGKSGEVVEAFKGELDFAKYESALERAIES